MQLVQCVNIVPLLNCSSLLFNLSMDIGLQVQKLKQLIAPASMGNRTLDMQIVCELQ